jgi:hypothetical protein
VRDAALPEGFDPLTPINNDPNDSYGPDYPENPWEINVHQQNGADVLKTLGFYVETGDGMFGQIEDLDKLIAMCDSTLGAVSSFPGLDSGVEATEMPGSGPRWFNGGRHPGSLTRIISKIRELAIIAKEKGGLISYA